MKKITQKTRCKTYLPTSVRNRCRRKIKYYGMCNTKEKTFLTVPGCGQSVSELSRFFLFLSDSKLRFTFRRGTNAVRTNEK